MRNLDWETNKRVSKGLQYLNNKISGSNDNDILEYTELTVIISFDSISRNSQEIPNFKKT